MSKKPSQIPSLKGIPARTLIDVLGCPKSTAYDYSSGKSEPAPWIARLAAPVLIKSLIGRK